MGLNLIHLFANLVLVGACNIRRVPLLQHTSFIICFVHASNGIDQMLFCCCMVFQYVSIINKSGASANAFTTRWVASLVVSELLALINDSVFHI